MEQQQESCVQLKQRYDKQLAEFEAIRVKVDTLVSSSQDKTPKTIRKDLQNVQVRVSFLSPKMYNFL